MENISIYFQAFERISFKSKMALFVILIGVVFIAKFIFSTSKPDTSAAITTPVSTNVVNQATSSVPEDDIEIISKTYRVQYEYTYVYVTVKNNSDHICRYITIGVHFFDSKNNVVGSGMGATTDLGPGKTRVIDCLGVDIKGATNYNAEVDGARFAFD